MMQALRLKRRASEDRHQEESGRLLAQFQALFREKHLSESFQDRAAYLESVTGGGDGFDYARAVDRERSYILGYASPFIRKFDLLTCVLARKFHQGE